MKKYDMEGFYLPGFSILKKTFYILLNLKKNLYLKYMNYSEKKVWYPLCMQVNGSYSYFPEI